MEKRIVAIDTISATNPEELARLTDTIIAKGWHRSGEPQATVIINPWLREESTQYSQLVVQYSTDRQGSR